MSVSVAPGSLSGSLQVFTLSVELDYHITPSGSIFQSRHDFILLGDYSLLRYYPESTTDISRVI
jgi:hypothetical protein